MSYAGHDGLDNLIVIYDSNDVTLDKMADFTQSEVLYEHFSFPLIFCLQYEVVVVNTSKNSFKWQYIVIDIYLL